MYKHLLIATDGSELAKKAVEQGFDLAKALDAKVTILTVTEPYRVAIPPEVVIAYPVEEYERGALENAKQILENASAIGTERQVACEIVHVKDAYPAEAIVQTANGKGCDLIVMASHGYRGLTRLFLGSQSHRVVTQSRVSVLICR